MLLHWLSSGWRSLIANPLFSLITIASLSIGCCGAILAGSVIKQHLSFDRWVPHSDRIAQVTYAENGKKEHFLIPGVKPALDGKVAGIKAVARVIPDAGYFEFFGDYFDADAAARRSQTLEVDPEYLEIFELPFLEGDRETALDEPGSIVITRRLADALVGPGPALGKTIERRNTGQSARVHRITGVIANISPASHVRFDSLARISDALSPRELGSVNLMIRPAGLYVRLDDDADVERTLALANHQIGEIMTQTVNTGRGVPVGKQAFAYDVTLVPLTEIHLGGKHADSAMSTAEGMALVILAAAALALLAVSAFNYVTMSLARSLRRRREVAIRKVVGASDGALAAHYLSESALVTVLSLLIGFALAELLHPWFARTVGQPEILFRLYDPVFLAVSLVAFAALSLATGAYPAFYLARVRPRAALDEADVPAPTLLSRIVSSGLLGFQIFAATTLLVFALTMAVQARYVAERPLGFSTRNLQFVGYYCPDGGRSEFAVQARCDQRTMEAIRGLPGVKRASLFGGGLFRDNLRLGPVSRAKGSPELGKTAIISVGPTALDVMQAKLLAGRMFDANSAYDTALSRINPETDKTALSSVPVIVTRAMLALIGAETPEAAIGQRIHVALRHNADSYEIVGVVEDWHQRSLRFAVNAIVFVPDAPILGAVIEIDPEDVAAAEAEMRAFWGREMPGMNSGLRWSSAVSDFELAYDRDSKLMAAVSSFAILAMAVAGLGVFGLSALDVQRRVREIGIRKALGAEPAAVAGLVIRRSVVSAAIASALSWPFGWWIANEWLSGYAYRTSLGLIILPLASLIVIACVAVAVGFNALLAAAIRPSHALRTAT